MKGRWEELKTEQEGREGIFHDVPETLPALLFAKKVQRRAATVGFEYPDAAGAFADLADEVDELRARAAATRIRVPRRSRRRATSAELGDVLFASVNVARRLNVDPELALRAATARFRGARRGGRAARGRRGPRVRELPLDEQDRFYDQAKEDDE